MTSDNPISVLRGVIVHGKGKGRTVGMPTANLRPERGMEIPGEGVYASIVNIRDGEYIGVTNIGRRPTVDNEEKITIETNILDFDRDIYGEYMTLRIMSYLSPIRKMNSLEEVKEQVEKDKMKAIEILDSELISP